MKVELLYPHIISTNPGFKPVEYYQPYHRRFAETYRKFEAGEDHRLRVIFCGGEPDAEAIALYDGLPVVFDAYSGPGWDIGAHQSVARELLCDIVMSFVTPAYFREDFWLTPFVSAFERYGDGLYGAMASYEHMPHIRTGSFCYSPETMRYYPWDVTSRETSFHFESGFSMNGKPYEKGEKCFTNWVGSCGKPVMLVTRNACYEMKDWRTPPNIFRRGDQSNCLVWDRHNDIYEAATPEEKRDLEAKADTIKSLEET